MARLYAALEDTVLDGVETNLDYLKQILRSSAFRDGRHTTQFLNGFHYRANTIDVLNPGCKPPYRITRGGPATGA